MSRGSGKTIGRRIRIRPCDDESARCSGSSRLDPPSAFSARTPPFTTPSTTSSPDPHRGSFEPKLPHSGKVLSQRRDAWRVVTPKCLLVRVAVTKPAELMSRLFGAFLRAEQLKRTAPKRARSCRRMATARTGDSRSRCLRIILPAGECDGRPRRSIERDLHRRRDRTYRQRALVCQGHAPRLYGRRRREAASPPAMQLGGRT
jgi:hypothetical protein